MREQGKGGDHAFGNAGFAQGVEGPAGVFHHVVEEAGGLFLVGLAHQSHGERVKDVRIPVLVHLPGVGIHGNLQRKVDLVHYSITTRLRTRRISRPR